MPRDLLGLPNIAVHTLGSNHEGESIFERDFRPRIADIFYGDHAALLYEALYTSVPFEASYQWEAFVFRERLPLRY